METRSWSDLPIDVVNQVSDRLSYLDFIRVGAVCKNWNSAKDERSRSSLRRPCLFTYPPPGGKFQFVDLTGQRIHECKTAADLLPNGLEPYACNNQGWFLFGELYSRWRVDRSRCPFKSFVFYNPLRGETIALPPLDINKKKDVYSMVATFTAPPTSPDCVVFVVVSCKRSLIICNLSGTNFGDERWRRIHRIRVPLQGIEVKDVCYIDGVFYCIIQKDLGPYDEFTLGTFNAAREEWNFMQEGSASLRIQGSSLVRLVGSNKELLLAVNFSYESYSVADQTDREEYIDYWLVYQFDWSRKDWSRVKSLGDRALLLSGPCSSMACPAVGKDDEFAGMIFDSELAYITCGNSSVWNCFKSFGSSII